MPSGLKIIFVASRFPYPLLQGDRVRGYHQLNYLSKRHRVTLVTPVSGSRDVQNLGAVAPLCERIVQVPISPWKRFRNLFVAAFRRAPWQVTFWYHSAVSRAVQRTRSQIEFDLAHVQLVRMAPVANALDGTPRVLDLIDALSRNCHRRAELQSGLIRLALRHEARCLHEYEKHVASLYNGMLISSATDRDFINAERHMHLVPNGVDLAAFPFYRGARDPNLIIFTGRMGYFPNADGAVWFASEVLPIIRWTHPAARLLIVGADPPARVRRLENLPGVEVTGYVSDLAACLRRASIAVSPLQSGSGMQFKILEAMASGTPSVVTPHSLGGIDAEDEKHLLVAQGIEDFAAATARMMGDGELRARIADAARDLVQSRYSWEHSLAKMEEVYRLAIEDHRKTASQVGTKPSISRRESSAMTVQEGRVTAHT